MDSNNHLNLSSEGFVLSDSTGKLGTGGPSLNSPIKGPKILIDEGDDVVSLNDSVDKSQSKINQLYSKSMGRNEKHRNFQIEDTS